MHAECALIQARDPWSDPDEPNPLTASKPDKYRTLFTSILI